MTDDFRLFGDGSDIDPDIALLTAYLAGELSIVQVTAVEERLVRDGEFRAKTQPVIDAWVQPVSFAPGVSHLPSRDRTNDLLGAAELSAGWNRYTQTTHADPAEPRSTPPRIGAAIQTRRRRSMTRIAAMIAAVALPAIGIAQAVVYIAHHQDVPGHGVARAIVAPFVVTEPNPRPKASPITTPQDIRLGKSLAPQVRETAGGALPIASSGVSTPPVQNAAPLPMPALIPSPAPSTVRLPKATLPEPNRKAMAAFAQQVQPDVVAGRKLAGYIIILFDRTGTPLWSTQGIGSVMLDVAGDTRTEAERAEFSRTYLNEFGTPTFDRNVVEDYVVVSDHRSLSGTTVKEIETPRDSTKPRFAKAAVGQSTALDAPVAGYRAGFAIVVNRGKISANSAAGLEIPQNGGSGIVGRPAASIARVDAYFFPKRELSPQILQVYAVYLK